MNTSTVPRHRFRVLICDDDEVYRIGLRATLKSLPEIGAVEDTPEAARALELSEEFEPQIALVSSELSGAVRPLAEALDRHGVPIIWLGPRSACEIRRAERPEADPCRNLTREASSATVRDSVRAALRV
jgi:DNA-binding NarL/FixJ family response regulator